MASATGTQGATPAAYFAPVAVAQAPTAAISLAPLTAAHFLPSSGTHGQRLALMIRVRPTCLPLSASLAAQAAAAHSLNGAIAAGGVSPTAYAAAAAAAAGFPMTVSQPGTPGATDSVYTNGLAQYSRKSL